jgi:peptide/nickel transport system substrate-binding protein
MRPVTTAAPGATNGEIEMKPVFTIVSLLALLAMVASCAPATTPTAPAKAAAPATVAPPAAATAPKVAATTAPAAPAATAAPAAPVSKIIRGGILIRAQAEDTNSWDPAFAVNSAVPIETPSLESLLYWALVDEKTGKHEVKPQLAESWTADDKAIVLKIRSGIRFHDGSDFDAEAARWQLERSRTNPKSLSRGYLGMVASIEAPDKSTLKLNLKQPSAVALINLTAAVGGTGSPGLMMVSKAYADKNGEAALSDKPIGTGPMALSEWKKDDKATYKKFDGYWRMGEDGKPLPYLDGAEVKVVKDKAVGIIEIRTGSSHFYKGIDDKDVAGVKANPDLAIIMMTWAASPNALGFNQKKSPFGSNVKLRQATQYALDRESLAKIIGFGNAFPSYYHFWLPSYPGYDETLPTYKFDVEKAKGLVKDAGYPNGVDVALTFDMPAGQKYAELVQQMLANAGIRAALNGIDGTTRKQTVAAGNWESIIFGMTPSPDPDMWSRMYTCDGGANWSTYCNPEMDKCMAEGGLLTDPVKRGEIYKRCQKILIEDSQIFGTYAIANNVAFRKEVKNMKVTQHLLDLREIWLDK